MCCVPPRHRAQRWAQTCLGREGCVEECFQQTQAISRTWHRSLPASDLNRGCPPPRSPSEADRSQPLVCLSQSPEGPASPLKGVALPWPAANSPASLQLSRTGRGHPLLRQNRRTKRSQSQLRRGEEEVSVPVVPCDLGPGSTLRPVQCLTCPRAPPSPEARGAVPGCPRLTPVVPQPLPMEIGPLLSCLHHWDGTVPSGDGPGAS